MLIGLLAVYLLAIFLPGPGTFLLSLSIPGVFLDTPNPMSHLVLGCLLFCAGLTVETAHMPRMNLKQLPWGLLAVWVIPLLVVSTFCLVLQAIEVPSGILVGLIIAAAMPVANASVGWAHLGRGNLPLILALVLGATITAPFIAPLIIHTAAAISLPDSVRIDHILPLGKLAGFLGFCVVLPMLCGALLGLWSRRHGMVWSILWLRRVSIICLLLLNYINASAALPFITDQSLVLQGVICSAMNIGLLVLFGSLSSRCLKAGESEQISISLACSMRNTGAALVLAGGQFALDPAVIMTIVLQTLLQNVAAGILVSFSTHPHSARPDCAAVNEKEVTSSTSDEDNLSLLAKT